MRAGRRGRRGGDARARREAFGYSGVFADPDGHTWEVASIKGLALPADGTVALGAAA